jgi:hypothetical protein
VRSAEPEGERRKRLVQSTTGFVRLCDLLSDGAGRAALAASRSFCIRSSRTNEKTIADFTRVVEQMGILERELPAADFTKPRGRCFFPKRTEADETNETMDNIMPKYAPARQLT